MEIDDKPFAAPLARLIERGETVSESFLPHGRRVPVGNGYQWLLRGWTMFTTAPLVWMGIAVGFMVLTLVVSATLFLTIAVNLLIPVFIGGISIGCRAIEEGQGIRFVHLFAGFSHKLGQLLLVGVLYLLAVTLMATLVGGVVALTGAGDPSLPLLTLGFFTTIVLFVPLAMAFWLSPPLVVWHDFSALQAIRSSFFVTRDNIGPFLLYGGLVMCAAVIASLPLLLGWLVLLPVLYASQYAFYRDVFFAQ